MNAAQFLLADGRPSAVWYCTKCMKTRAHMSQGEAERCCVPVACKECGQPIEPDKGHYTLTHYQCQLDRRERITAERIAKAEKLESWDGWVYVEGVGPQDGYFESVEALVDHLMDRNDEDGDSWPEWAFVCKAKRFISVDVERIIQDICEDSYEDWDSSDLAGVEEFAKAAAAFNEANKGCVVYHDDPKRVVRVSSRAECLAGQ